MGDAGLPFGDRIFRPVDLMTFLAGADIKTELQRLSDNESNAKYAVAYWGRGALEMAALAKLAAPAIIICDALSGACNPDELERILAAGHSVWTLHRLHSKVYLTSKGVLIGSANASANGLGREGVEAGTIEAALVSSDADIMAAAERFIADKLAQAEEVTRATIPAVREAWRRHRRSRPLPRRQPLLDAVMAQPEAFEDRGLRVIAYVAEDAPAAVDQKFESIAEDHYEPADLARYAERGEYPIYYDKTGWDVDTGDTLIDFTLDDRLNAEFQGLWRVKENAFHVVNQNDRIVLLDRLSSYEGFSFDAAQAQRIGRLVTNIAIFLEGATDLHSDVVDLSIVEIVRLLRLFEQPRRGPQVRLLSMLEDEWILLLDLYLRFRPVRLTATRSEVQAISRVLKAMGRLAGRSRSADFRTPAGLVRELDVFRHLDGFDALAGARRSRIGSEVWARLSERPDLLALEVARVRNEAVRPGAQAVEDEPRQPPV